jgi:hypothetical protein
MPQNSRENCLSGVKNLLDNRHPTVVPVTKHFFVGLHIREVDVGVLDIKYK